MRKFKYFIDFDKEEKWLNRLAKDGYQFEGKSFGYKFHQAQTENTIIKIDYRNFKRGEPFYLKLLLHCLDQYFGYSFQS